MAFTFAPRPVAPVAAPAPVKTAPGNPAALAEARKRNVEDPNSYINQPKYTVIMMRAALEGLAQQHDLSAYREAIEWFISFFAADAEAKLAKKAIKGSAPAAPAKAPKAVPAALPAPRTAAPPARPTFSFKKAS